MQRREWLAPPRRPPLGQTTQSSDMAASSKSRGLLEYVVRFVSQMILFGAIGLWFSSWFPIALGLFLFFTDDEFIAWTLRSVGIRLVPDTLGPEFIKAFVFFTGLWVLLAYWKDSAPAWLELPPSISWALVAAAALFCAVLKIVSVVIVKKLLPMFRIEIAPPRQSWAILVVLGMLIALVVLVLFAFGF
jgi:hypothetical protein